jgi:hypothetical protein
MPKMQPIMPMPMPMQMYTMSNPYLMQTLYQQDIMRQKELQQLNNNYEYQLNRQKSLSKNGQRLKCKTL